MSEKKKLTNLWHSALVKMTAEQPVAVKIKQKPTKSKYPGKPPFAILIIDGVDYAYNVESHEVEVALKENAGKTVMLTADGRDEDASVDIIIAAAGERARGEDPQPRRTAAANRRPGPEPDPEDDPQGGEQAPGDYEEPRGASSTRPTRPQPANDREAAFEACVKNNIKFTKARAKGLFMCLRAVREAGREFHAMFPDEPPITAEAEASFVATIYISGDRSGNWDGMPYKPLGNYL